jgi:hypothetical protein
MRGSSTHYVVCDVVHKHPRFKQYLEAGVLPDGSVRQHDIVQFYTPAGGLRTVYAKDLVL